MLPLHFLALNLGTGLSIGIAVAALLVMFNVGELKTLFPARKILGWRFPSCI